MSEHNVVVSEVELSYLQQGSGPALLLLHGFPQNRSIWRRVCEQLSGSFTLIMPDLRGYGQSPKPASDAHHENYSKRTMARDLIALMDRLGIAQFGVVGHDRGGRVAHRLAADFPHRVQRLMLLDISPTLKMYEQTDMKFALGYWHWFFLVQAAPLPEQLIGADPQGFMESFMIKRYSGRSVFEPQNWAQYLEAIKDPACLHAMCEDYRASVTVDLEHDRADRAKGARLSQPLRVLWGQHGMIERCFDPINDWLEVAQSVSGRALDAGHYLPEERPEEVASEIGRFFS